MRLDHLLSREKINCCLVLKVQPSKEEKEKIASIFEYKKHQKAKQNPFYKIVSDEFEADEENLKEHIRICD